MKKPAEPNWKKGQMYSIIMVVAIIPLVLFLLVYVTESQNIRFGVKDKVISDQQHQVEKQIENDFSRALKIIAKRALLSAVNKVTIDGTYLDNSTLRIHELITNASLYGSPSVLMANNTLEQWRSRMLSQNHQFSVESNFSDVRVENYDGINLKVSMLLTVNVSDSLNISRIDKTLRKEVLVSVEGLEDPIFPLSTTGYVKKVIDAYPFAYFTKKTQGSMNIGNCSGNSTYDPADPNHASKILIISNASGISDATVQGFEGVVEEDAEDLGSRGVLCFVSGAANALQNIPENQTVYIDSVTSSAWLMPVIEEEMGYYYKGRGPNFLQRLEGDLSESPDGMGLESFVMDEIGIPSKPNQTRTDYLFFSNQSYLGCSKVRWAPGWLRIRPEEASAYNLTELSYVVC